MTSSIPSQRHPRFATDAAVDILTTDSHLFASHTLANLSLSGAFVRSLQPYPPGSELRLRLRLGEEVLRASARVVHVLDAETAERKGHPPGMGIVFVEMEPSTRRLLWAAVTRLANANLQATVARTLDPFMRPSAPARSVQPRSAPTATPPTPARARFAGADRVEVLVPDRASLEALWRAGLCHAQLFVETSAPPPVGARLTVELDVHGERLSLLATVAHVLEGGAAAKWGRAPGVGLRLLDLDRDARARLEEIMRLPAGRTGQLSG